MTGLQEFTLVECFDMHRRDLMREKEAEYDEDERQGRESTEPQRPDAAPREIQPFTFTTQA